MSNSIDNDPMLTNTGQLRLAAGRLKRSERGQRVLEAFSHLWEAGAPGLDSQNQRAFMELIVGMFETPYDMPAELCTRKDSK